MNEKILTQENLPWWTRLAWKADPATVRIVVHRDVVESLYSIPENSMIIQQFSDYGDFSGTPEGGWGFERCLRQKVFSTNPFVLFDAVLPRVKVIAEEPCTRCNGTGENQEMSNRCLHCENGHPVSYEWQDIMRLSASVSVLAETVCRLPPQRDTSAITPQMLSFETVTEWDACSLAGLYSVVLAHWLRSEGDRTFDEAELAITAAWEAMMGKVTDLDRDEICARVEHGDGWLNITCPDGRSGLHPSGSFRPNNRGFPFSSHNVNDAAKQFALLAGLAAIEQQARRELCL
jgi:hypothetical protein